LVFGLTLVMTDVVGPAGGPERPSSLLIRGAGAKNLDADLDADPGVNLGVGAGVLDGSKCEDGCNMA
jgi:hypothetical protein